MHIYLFGISINRMLILQLKIFLSVNLCFHFDSLCNLVFLKNSQSRCYKRDVTATDITPVNAFPIIIWQACSQ